MATRITALLISATLAASSLAEPELRTSQDRLDIKAEETSFEFRNPTTRRTDRVAISDLADTASRVRKQVEPTVEDLTAAVIALAEAAKAQKKLAEECPTPCDGESVMETEGGACTAAPIACAVQDRQIEELEQTIASIAEDQGDEPFWTKSAAVVSSLDVGTPVIILGFNLAEMYHPKLDESFNCIWEFTDDKSKVELGGAVAKEGAHYHIECGKPPAMTSKRSAKLSIINSVVVDGNGNFARVPYKGPAGGDTITFDNNWFGAEVMDGKVFIHAEGLQTDTKYSIKMNSVGGRGTTRSDCSMASSTILDCGAFPSGAGWNTIDDYMMVEITISDGNEMSYGGSGKPHVKLPLCLNNRKDTGETGTDCGGMCVANELAFGSSLDTHTMGKCSNGESCEQGGDCTSGLCFEDVCKGDGSTKELAGESCKSLMKVFNFGAKKNDDDDGFYWVQGDGSWKDEPKRVHCIMNQGRNGGGWMSLAKTWYQQSRTSDNSDYGNVEAMLKRKGESYNLAADFVNHIIGESELFDVYGGQHGHHTHYSAGNYEYVTVENYKGKWQWAPRMPESKKTTVWKAWRLSDNALAWTGRLQCGQWGQYGINCDCGSCQNNPGAGAGCNIKMGRYTNWGWHHFYMSNTNSDTYLYICNGPQHSSGQDMNHIWYFREQRDIGAGQK